MQETKVQSNSSCESVHDDEIATLLRNEKRLSLAYGALEEVPFLILEYIADKIQILDLSHNHFQDLSFLECFPNLQILILDKNIYLDCESMPVMTSLETIWLNNCNIINITEWLTTLRARCPVLKQLSMMCNPVGSTVLNGVSDSDEREYRTNILKILPSLEYFDGIRINDEQRKLALSQPKVSFTLLEDIFRKKVLAFIEFSKHIHKNYMSLEKLNASFIKNKNLNAKKISY